MVLVAYICKLSMAVVHYSLVCHRPNLCECQGCLPKSLIVLFKSIYLYKHTKFYVHEIIVDLIDLFLDPVYACIIVTKHENVNRRPNMHIYIPGPTGHLKNKI